MSFLLKINEDELLQLLSIWLDIQSLSILDIAITNCCLRPIWLTCLRAIDSTAIKGFSHYPSSIKWLVDRDITISSIQINPNYEMGIHQFMGLNTSALRSINLRGCPVFNGVLTYLALACPYLQNIDLEECSVYGTEVAAFAQRCPQLERISLRNSSGIAFTGFMELAENCPLLKSVDFSGCENVNDMILAALARGCPSLKSIIIRCDRLAARSRLDTLKYRCPKGSFLDSTNSYRRNRCQVTDFGVIALVEGCPFLEVIDLGFCAQVTGASIAAISVFCPLLKVINIESVNLATYTDTVISTLAHGCRQLECIILNHFNIVEHEDMEEITDEGIYALAQCCPKLQIIDLTGCRLVTDTGIQAIAQGCPFLKILCARDASRVTGASLVALGDGCHHLEEIGFSEKSTFTNTDFHFLITQCPKLRTVDCHMHTLCKQLVASGCPNLQYISLHDDVHCALIGGGCHRLEVVEISQVVTDVGLKALARGSPLLTDIRVCGGVTDEGLSVLAQCCPLLHTIDLSGCSEVTDAGLLAIAQWCPSLKTIYLNDTYVSIAAVNVLIASCPRLMFIGVDDEYSEYSARTKLTLGNFVDDFAFDDRVLGQWD